MFIVYQVIFRLVSKPALGVAGQCHKELARTIFKKILYYFFIFCIHLKIFYFIMYRYNWNIVITIIILPRFLHY